MINDKYLKLYLQSQKTFWESKMESEQLNDPSCYNAKKDYYIGRIDQIKDLLDLMAKE